MSHSDISFFQVASQRMQWLADRQRVTAQNIANSDTPGFEAQDIAPFSQVLGEARDEPARARRDDTAWSISPDGNSVVLEQQTIRAAQTAGEHRLASQLYRKGVEMLTLAGGGS
nr:flagellar basal body protein [Pseudoroseicyclus aestuarii]